jgi:hypothetical protein
MAKEYVLAILLTVAACALFVLLWYWTNNYVIANFVLMLALALVYRVHVVKSLVFAIAFSLGSYYFFSKVLQVLLYAR